MERTREQGPPRPGLDSAAAPFAAREPQLGSLGTHSPHGRPRFPQPNTFHDGSTFTPRWSPRPNQHNGDSSFAPQAFPQSIPHNGHPQHAPQMSSGSNQYNGGFSYAPQAFPQPNLSHENPQYAPQLSTQWNQHNDGSSYAPQAFPLSIPHNGHPQRAPQMSSRSNQYNGGFSYAPQAFPPPNPYHENPQYAPQLSSGPNQYNGHFPNNGQSPYAPSTREAESAWWQPPLPAVMPSVATPDHPILQSNPPNSSVPAPMSGPEISNVYNSDHSLGAFNVQGHEHQRATMTGHNDEYAAHLQQQIRGDPQFLPHSEGWLACVVCGMLIEEEHLQLHRSTHRCLRCSKCYKWFESRPGLWWHQCEGKRFTCDRCPRSFLLDFDLAAHRERVHRVPASRCRFCPFIFSTRELLNVRYPPIDSGNA